MKDRELWSKLEIQDWVIFDLEEENRILKKDHTQLKVDVENMMRVMEDNEA